jgi:hypothetical protein
MEITVTFDNGKLRTVPDPAIVSVGTPITWLCRSPRLTVPLARWMVYFNRGSPLHLQRGDPLPALTQIRVTTRNTHLGTIISRAPQILNLLKDAGVETDDVVDHSGVAGPVFADEQGDYKYGVRIESASAEKDELLDDDDPRLIVERR